jgi:repressor of nif and glnA expression
MKLRDSPAAAILATVQMQTDKDPCALVGYEQIQKALKNKGVNANIRSLRVYVQRLRDRKLVKTIYYTFRGYESSKQSNKYAHFNLTRKGQQLLLKWQDILNTSEKSHVR